MEAGRESRPVNGASAHAFATVIGAESQRVCTADDSKVLPVQVVGAGFVAYPVLFAIPEGAGVETDDFEAGAREALQHDATTRAYADDYEIDFLLAIVAHRNIDRLHRPKVVMTVARLLERLMADVGERAADGRVQCVPSWPIGSISSAPGPGS